MSKLISKVLILLICISLVLTGCAESKESDDTESGNIKNESQVEENKGEKKIRKRPDMFGRVKSIIANEVVLEIAEMPERPANNGENQRKKGEEGAKGEGNGGGQRRQGAGGRELKLTGETATLLIPVGIPISTRSQNGIKEIDLADIYVGSILQIWFEDGDEENKAITNVMMLQGRE